MKLSQNKVNWILQLTENLKKKKCCDVIGYKINCCKGVLSWVAIKSNLTDTFKVPDNLSFALTELNNSLKDCCIKNKFFKINCCDNKYKIDVENL